MIIEETGLLVKRDGENNGPGDAKTRLILAAEILFAKGGLDNASLREIALTAGQGNNYAVQYHFGSREGLIHAVFDYRMLQMDAPRGVMLAKAEEGGLLQDARTLFEIIFLPQIALEAESGEPTYANFLCQYLLRYRSIEFGNFSASLPTHLDRTLKLLRRRLIYLPEAAAQRRLVSACFMFLNILVTRKFIQAVSPFEECFDRAVNDTLDQIVLATCMPLDYRH